MRWLLLKDLQILRRSPLMVATVVLYPVLLALMVGLATNAGPDKPRVAFLNEVPTSKNEVTIGSERVDASQYANQIFKAIDPIRVDTREEARELVEGGQVVAALIVPEDITDRLQQSFSLISSADPPSVEVLYNAENALKEREVRAVITAQLARANAALSRQLTDTAGTYIDLIVNGGEFALLGIEVLGLRRAQEIIEATITSLRDDAPLADRLGDVARFAELAAENLDLAGAILESIRSPIRVDETIVNGRSSTLDAFAIPLTVTVALMFVTLLLAAGMLALEREEQAFGRLVRGLVSRLALVAEKVVLAALCATVVSVLMLALLGALVDLDWGRAPLWAPAVAISALAFGALGVAVGSLAREVRSASLIVFALSLPMVALALVPSGAVTGAFATLIDAVNAVLPFKWALQAIDAAVNNAEPSLLGPALHLAALTLLFGAVARLALKRFA
jgi:ABC-type transport system involved in cytochrome c biogenesis permease component